MKRLDRIEETLNEVVAQLGWLKQWVELIRMNTDDVHLGMDGLYQVEETSGWEESEESEENDWEAELEELRIEEIESMQTAGVIETEEEDKSGSEYEYEDEA
jgi:hypothetical protein